MALGRAFAPLAGLLAGALLALGCRGGSRPIPAPGSPPDLLLITVDTVRADRVGCYGYGPAATPVMDGLASGGVLFEQAHSHVPLTLPSHATLLSGNLPPTLRVRVNGLRVGREVETLATRLSEKGYWTGAAVGSSVLDRAGGLASGFRAYDDAMSAGPPGGGARVERPAGEVTRAALSLLDRADGPAFLWVHYYDPHAPYAPPPPFAERFASGPYDGEIAYMDASIGALLEGFRARRPGSAPLVALAGDHGEGLGDHGEREHGIFLYEYALRVPLVLSWEGVLPAGLRVPDLCGLADLAPTLMDLMGFGPFACDGRSLRPLLEGGGLPGKPLYAESYHGAFDFGWAPLRAVMDSRWKFIEAPEPELYAWREGEGTNAYAPEHPAAETGRAELARIPALRPEEELAMRGIREDPSQAETLAKLRSLGYISGGAPPPRPGEPPDPKRAIRAEAELTALSLRLEAGDAAGVVAPLLGLLRDNPQNPRALSLLGLAYMRAGQFAEARACFEREIALRPTSAVPHLNMGTALRESGRADLAERAYREALRLDPRFAEAVSNLAYLLLEAGRDGEARKLLEGALDEGVASADIWFEKGFLEARASRWRDAREAFERSAELNPGRRGTWENLSRVHAAQGNRAEAEACLRRARGT